MSTPSVYQMKLQFHYCSNTMHLLHAVNVVSDTITTTAAFNFPGSTTVATPWCHMCPCNSSQLHTNSGKCCRCV